MPPEGITTFNFQQVPQQQPQLHYRQARQALPSTSASSVTRVSTTRPHIYDVSSINNMYGCGGGQPPGIGAHRHYFDINQLNSEHLRGLPRGSLRRWAILCDTGAVTSVAPRNFADHVPLQVAKVVYPTQTVFVMLSTTKEIEHAKKIGILNWPDDAATHATFDKMLLPISCVLCPKLKALLKDARAGALDA